MQCKLLIGLAEKGNSVGDLFLYFLFLDIFFFLLYRERPRVLKMILFCYISFVCLFVGRHRALLAKKLNWDE